MVAVVIVAQDYGLQFSKGVHEGKEKGMNT